MFSEEPSNTQRTIQSSLARTGGSPLLPFIISNLYITRPLHYTDLGLTTTNGALSRGSSTTTSSSASQRPVSLHPGVSQSCSCLIHSRVRRDLIHVFGQVSVRFIPLAHFSSYLCSAPFSISAVGGEKGIYHENVSARLVLCLLTALWSLISFLCILT